MTGLQFTASVLFPDATNETRIASGYNRLLQTTEEGGAQAKEYTAKYAADRVRNASTVWLGLTLGCAECHDHKFDPLTTREFYRFAAFFNAAVSCSLCLIGTDLSASPWTMRWPTAKSPI